MASAESNGIPAQGENLRVLHWQGIPPAEDSTDSIGEHRGNPSAGAQNSDDGETGRLSEAARPMPENSTGPLPAKNDTPPSNQAGFIDPMLLPRQPTGWAAVEKALTDFDKQEIGDYKEDIDTLLVFVSCHFAW